MILLTGANGKTAGVTARLLAGKVPLRALVRNQAKAEALKALGVEIVVGDVDNDAVLAAAMKGVTDALLLLPNGEHQERLEKKFIDAAKAAGVKRVVKVSSIEATSHATAKIPRIHAAVEDYLRASGVGFTMVRPNFYMANLFGNAASIKAAGTIVMPAGNGKIGAIDSRDVGAVIAHVLSTPGHTGKSYALSGPESLSLAQVAQAFSDVLGKPITYINQPMAEYAAKLAAFLPKWHAEAVGELIGGIGGNSMDVLTSTVQDMLGRAPISLAQFIKDNIAVYR